jgi:hypothetical protein
METKNRYSFNKWEPKERKNWRAVNTEINIVTETSSRVSRVIKVNINVCYIQSAPSCYHVNIFVFCTQSIRIWFNPFRSYVGPRPTLWFSCSRCFSWSLILSNPIFLPPTYSPALIYFWREKGWWITCNYPTVLNETNISRNRERATCAICWLKSVLHEEKRREQENHTLGRRTGKSDSRKKSESIIFLFPTLFLM